MYPSPLQQFNKLNNNHMTGKQQLPTDEQKLVELIHQNENQLDELVKKLYQNRLDKRQIIQQLYSLQNPNIDETQKQKTKKDKKKK